MTNLTHGEVHLLLALLSYCDFDEDIAWVTKPELSSHTGLHPQTIKNMLSRLRKDGLVGDAITRRGRRGIVLRLRDADLPKPLAAARDAFA